MQQAQNLFPTISSNKSAQQKIVVKKPGKILLLPGFLKISCYLSGPLPTSLKGALANIFQRYFVEVFCHPWLRPGIQSFPL
jgi:hypothetical protein